MLGWMTILNGFTEMFLLTLIDVSTNIPDQIILWIANKLKL